MRNVIVFVLLLVVPTAALAAQAWDGEWSYAGGKAEIAAMEKAVDEIVDEMGFLMRPIARPRLKKEAQPWKKVRIQRSGENITVATDDGELTSPLGEKVTRQGESGKLTVHRRMRGDVLVDTVTSERGGRTNEFRISGDELRVQSEIFAPQLPRPVKFSYTYD